MASKKEQELKKIKDPEQRLQFIYKELFWMSEKIHEMHDHQKELGSLIVDLTKEIESLRLKIK